MVFVRYCLCLSSDCCPICSVLWRLSTWPDYTKIMLSSIFNVYQQPTNISLSVLSPSICRTAIRKPSSFWGTWRWRGFRFLITWRLTTFGDLSFVVLHLDKTAVISLILSNVPLSYGCGASALYEGDWVSTWSSMGKYDSDFKCCIQNAATHRNCHFVYFVPASASSPCGFECRVSGLFSIVISLCFHS